MIEIYALNQASESLQDQNLETKNAHGFRFFNQQGAKMNKLRLKSALVAFNIFSCL